MNEKILRRSAIQGVILLIITVIVSISVTRNSQILIHAEGEETLDSDVGQNIENTIESANLALEQSNEEVENLSEKYIKIKKPEGLTYLVELQDIYMTRSIQLTLKGNSSIRLKEENILRYNEGEEFSLVKTVEPLDYDQSPSEETKDPLRSFEIVQNSVLEGLQYVTILNLNLDDIYAHQITQDDQYIYVDLLRPKDVYDKIIVIDAGHGGKDIGTHTLDEKYIEKDLNLKLLLELKTILDQTEYKVYYTRIVDETIFLNPRVYLANDLEADIFLSIHCNSNGSSAPSGVEVLYNELDKSTSLLNSKSLSEICLEEVSAVVGRVNRGLVDGSDKVVIGKSQVPVALVEVGFMSNTEDLNFLLQEDNQKRIAEALYQVIERAVAILE